MIYLEGLVMFGVSRIKFFAKSGARLYIPNKLITHEDFPFEDGGLVKIEFGKNEILVISKPEWWEMLDWEKMPKAYEGLPEDIKEKIRGKKI